MNGPGCQVCNTLPPGDLIELDLLLADPMRWPVTIWGVFPPPEGAIPASYRRFGALRMGTAWLDEHGYSGAFSAQVVRRHWRYDVPVLDVDIETLISRGMVTTANSKPGSTTTPIDPLAFVRLYAQGMELGIRGLTLLNARVQSLIDQKDQVPLPLIKMMIDAGTKLAMSQASIKASGKPFGDAALDENAAFMGSDASPVMGHSRVRTIEGERRPVVDEGKADRDHYNERAAQEGGIRIGGR